MTVLPRPSMARGAGMREVYRAGSAGEELVWLGEACERCEVATEALVRRLLLQLPVKPMSMPRPFYLVFALVSVLSACADENKVGSPNPDGGTQPPVMNPPACASPAQCPTGQTCLGGRC